MTTAILALILFLAIAAQVAFFALRGLHQRRRQYRGLQQTAAEPAASAITDARDTDATLAGSAGTPAWEGFREFVVQGRVIEDAMGAICSFYLAPTDGRPLPAFRPGQYLTFRLPVTDPLSGADKTLTRCYSLSERPRPDYYRVSIKRVPAPAGSADVPPGLSSNHFHDSVRQGDRLMVKAPAGRFHLTDEGRLPVVLIGGGIGITPMLSILNTLLERPGSREIRLYYGVRNGREHIMRGHLQALAAAHPNFHLHVCYSRPDAGDVEGADYRHRGHVDLALLRTTLGPGRHEFYLCGPGPMMETLVPALQDWGVASQDIHYEAFGPASPVRGKAPAGLPQQATQAISVTFSRSGKRIPWDAGADSLLAFAEANGIAVDSGCRAGSCGGCQTRIDAGEVAYHQEADADLTPGHCLLCISHPKGDLTLAA